MLAISFEYLLLELLKCLYAISEFTPDQLVTTQIDLSAAEDYILSSVVEISQENV